MSKIRQFPAYNFNWYRFGFVSLLFVRLEYILLVLTSDMKNFQGKLRLGNLWSYNVSNSCFNVFVSIWASAISLSKFRLVVKKILVLHNFRRHILCGFFCSIEPSKYFLNILCSTFAQMESSKTQIFFIQYFNVYMQYVRALFAQNERWCLNDNFYRSGKSLSGFNVRSMRKYSNWMVLKYHLIWFKYFNCEKSSKNLEQGLWHRSLFCSAKNMQLTSHLELKWFAWNSSPYGFELYLYLLFELSKGCGLNFVHLLLWYSKFLYRNKRQEYLF